MGFLEVFHQRDPDHYHRIARYPTALEPVCSAWMGKLFVAVRGEPNAEIRAPRRDEETE